MPLHADHPVPAAFPFYSFHDAIRRVGGNAQPAAGLENRLVMRAVDLGFASACPPARQFRQMSALDAHRVQPVVPVFVLIVIDRGL